MLNASSHSSVNATNQTVRSYRVKCQECGKQTTATNGVCANCGQNPGVISSYRDCPHNPVHTWKEKGKCIKRTARDRKRVKHVVSSGEVPHLWFHKVQWEAHNATRSLFFRDSTIYSYGTHFPIATHVTRGKGKHAKSAVLFTTRSYSITTSSHCSAVRSAIPSSAIVFSVPEVFTDSNDRWSKDSHAKNVADYLKRIETQLATCARGRTSWTKEWNQKAAKGTVAELKTYCQFFKLKTPKPLPVVPALDSKAMAQIKAREKEKAAQKAEETARRKEQARIAEMERAKRWRNGENVGNLYNSPVMLRIRIFGADEEVAGSVGRVETSLGAQVPIEHALRGLRFVRQVVKSGQEYVRNGHTFHLGHYAIDRIETDGTLLAGCHVIDLAEIERIAPELEKFAAQINGKENQQ